MEGAERANASRQELVAGGMHEGKIARIQGLAASMSLIKDDPFAAVNRRISLVVLNQRTQRRIEAENAAASSAVPGGDPAAGPSALETVESLAQPPRAQPPVQGTQ